MNASAYIENLTYSIPCVKYKSTIQPANISQCNAFKEQLGPAIDISSSLYIHTVNDYTPTTICSDNYKEKLLPKYAPYATDEYTNTSTPTSVCSQINYKLQLKRINCNTMV